MKRGIRTDNVYDRNVRGNDMKKRKLKRIFSAFLAAALVFTMNDWGAGRAAVVQAGTISGSQNANFDFENGTEGWDTTGTVTVLENSAQSGSKYVHLEPNSSITMTLTDIAQGSYTLSAWVKGTAAGNNSQLTVTETGGPDTVSLLDTYLSTDWKQMGNRNVLVYNGQMKITIESGNSTLNLDNLDLALDSEDANTIANWDFEDGLTSWTSTGTAEVDTANADTGEKAIRLAAGSEISQKVKVEPNTRYSVTMRAKVDTQDVFETIYHTNYRGKSGETQNRTSLGDRVNLGVRGADGTVLRQAPSGTEGYSLVSITFQTDADTTEVEVYANTIYDEAYKDSVTVYKTEGTELADDWQGNGSDNAYVDNFDLFTIQDENYLRGADVSFLPAIEDLGGKYFANGVQQDCLRILSNHGVNSILNMIMVHAGNPAHDETSCEIYYHDWWTKEDGSAYALKMIDGGYFDKEHSLELGKRATALGMSYVPSFHYSDTWVSNSKAYTPEEWLNVDYEGNYSNSDIEHIQSIVYNYVYDFMKTLAENNVNVAAVKHGNEQNGGLIWPVGHTSTGVNHAKIIAASYEAAEDAMPGVSGWVHSNNGYTPSYINTFFGALLNNGAKMDGLSFSLYGGRSSGNTIAGLLYQQSVEAMKYMDYVNVETGFSFTKYNPTVDTEGNGTSMGMKNYYKVATPNGQYNWLLDYMQAALDAPNPYGQTRGFYYWETDWIPTPGAGSSDGATTSNVNQRIMFNNGDTSIKEMGSSQPGRAGDMMDSMYAYLMRGCPKTKASTMQTPINDGIGDYEVEVVDPTGITLAETDITLAEGKKTRLQPTIAPTDKVVSDSDVVYTSADSSIASVTTDGFVVAKKAGTTTVTATVKGGHSATANVTVTAAGKASGINLTLGGSAVSDKEQKTANIFERLQLSAALTGTPTDTSVVYTSSNPEVASFFGETWQTPEGEMRQETEKDTQVQLNAKNEGTTTITVASADGAVSTSFTLTVEKTAVESVTMNKSEVSLSYGRTTQLSATVFPADTSRYKVNWVSENTSIATVDENGLVTGVGIGDTVIKAVSDDNEEVYDTCTVHVLQVQTEGVTLDKTAIAIQEGSAKTLHALVTPDDAYEKGVTWKSSDETIATVNEAGEVTGVKVGGPVTITATTKNGGFEATCQVTVQKDAIPVTGVVLSEEEYYFVSDYYSETNPDESVSPYRLSASVEPEMATNGNVTWNSDTPEVATVDEFGRVTPVSAGVATITATTEDGGYTASAKIYVPTVSESFDNRSIGDNWGATKVSSAETNTAAKLSSAVAVDGENQIFQMVGSGNGSRSITKTLTQSIKNDKVILDFDWNVGAPVGLGGGYIAITDSNNMRYLSVQTNSNTELVYSVGGAMASSVLADAQPVGTGFNVNNTWYHLHVVIDMKESKTTFTITSLANAELTATHETAFDSSAFAGDVASIQVFGVRTGSVSWTTSFDNFNIYEAAPTAKGITVNKEKVRMIPIEGTLMASCQLEASVNPASVEQELVWTSSDSSVATVSADGLVTPAKLYQSLDDVIPGSCVIKVASAKDTAVYKEIPVEISNSPNASEFFTVKDENGDTVYGGGESQVISMEAADRKQLFPVLTGGDGDTDIAGVEWVSSKTEIVSIDSAGKMTAKAPGTAKITLTVTLYVGEPQVAEIDVEVTGEVIADTSALEAAIAEAKAAKDKADNRYTPDSLAAYTSALAKAESDLKAAVEEKWNAQKQSVLDADVEALKLAVEGLTEMEGILIESIAVSGYSNTLSIGKTLQLNAAVTPDNATEQIIWSSSDTSVAVVDKLNGMIIAVGEGTAVITARSEIGNVESQTEITVASDMTSYFEDNLITITGVNTVANREVTNTFKNARETDWSKWETANVWTTGSSTTAGSIVIDFGMETRIDNVKTVFWSLLKYTLDVSDDGSTWTTIVDHSDTAAGATLNDSEFYTDIFPDNTKARYLRINVLGNAGTSDWIGVNTVQVNGEYLSGKKLVEYTSCDSVILGMDEEAATEKLPSTVAATLSDGTTMDAEVTWSKTELQKAFAAGTAGDYQVHGTITVEGISYDVVCTLTLTLVDISAAVVTLEEDSYQYTGTAKEPGVIVELNGRMLTSSDYTVTYANNVEVGTATVTITGTGKYTGTAAKNFVITKPVVVKEDLRNAVVKLEYESCVYTGAANEPKVVVTLDGKTVPASEYVITYTNNVKVGTASVTITAAASSEKYTGAVTKTFEITDAGTQPGASKSNLGNAAVTLGYTSCTYTGAANKPQVTVTLGKKTVPASEYVVTYANNINAGTAKVTITATASSASYTGSIVKTFTINKASKQIKVKKTSIAKTYGNSAFSLGASVTGKEKLTYSLSNKTVIKIVSGKAKIVGCGKVTVTVKSAASANYKAAANKKITIAVKPKKATLSSAKSKKAGQITLKWKKDSKATGYVISYSTSKSFKKAKTVTIKKNKTTSTTIKKLKKGKTYYVRICSYKTVGKKKVCGAYSKAKRVTVKKS